MNGHDHDHPHAPITADGEPPAAARSRALEELLVEKGVISREDVELRVLDSTADVRYLVIPRRPAGTEGLSEEELAALVTRDSMIGVADARSPAAAPA